MARTRRLIIRLTVKLVGGEGPTWRKLFLRCLLLVVALLTLAAALVSAVAALFFVDSWWLLLASVACLIVHKGARWLEEQVPAPVP